MSTGVPKLEKRGRLAVTRSVCPAGVRTYVHTCACVSCVRMCLCRCVGISVCETHVSCCLWSPEP